MVNVDRLSALNAAKNSWEFSSNKKPKCPHCGKDFDITENEAWHLYDDNDSHEVECPSCSMTFRVNSSASWNFSTDEQEPS